MKANQITYSKLLSRTIVTVLFLMVCFMQVLAVDTAIPTFSPVPGAYIGSVDVAISNATPGASIRYTIDNSDPSATFGDNYNPLVGIHLAASATIRAYAYASGMTDSAVATGVYSIYYEPTITKFNLDNAAANTLLTISGTNFKDVSNVKFNGVAASFSVVNMTTITAVVPTSATTGKIAVTTLGGTAISTVDFRIIQPIMLSTTPNSPTAEGIPVLLTATPTGIGSGTLQYRFKIKYMSGGVPVLQVIQPYGLSNTCTWTPMIARDYTLYAEAICVGLKSSSAVYSELPYTVIPKTAISMLAMTISPVSPTAVGAQVKIKAIATGGGILEYMFKAKYATPSGFVWQTLQDYSQNSICIWSPSEAHVYTVIAYVREKGSSVPYSLYREQFITVNPTATGINVKVTPPNTTKIGVPVTFSPTTIGGGTLEYSYKVKYLAGNTYVWQLLRSYSLVSNFTWTPTVAQNYIVYVYAREVGTMPNQSYTTFKEIPYVVTGKLGPTPVDLGMAGNFVILAKSAVSTTGTTSVVGNIGISPAARSFITGFADILDSTNTFSTSSIVTGKIYAANMAPPTPDNMTTTVSNMETAYTDAAGRTLPDFTELGAGDISGMTLVPGLYKWGTGVSINTDVTLSGGPFDVWIFQIAEDLTVANGKIVHLTGGALAKNIFWQVAGQTTIGTNADFKGVVLCQTQIVMQTGAKFNGRALAQTVVTLGANAVTQPAM